MKEFLISSGSASWFMDILINLETAAMLDISCYQAGSKPKDYSEDAQYNTTNYPTFCRYC